MEQSKSLRVVIKTGIQKFFEQQNPKDYLATASGFKYQRNQRTQRNFFEPTARLFSAYFLDPCSTFLHLVLGPGRLFIETGSEVSLISRFLVWFSQNISPTGKKSEVNPASSPPGSYGMVEAHFLGLSSCHTVLSRKLSFPRSSNHSPSLLFTSKGGYSSVSLLVPKECFPIICPFPEPCIFLCELSQIPLCVPSASWKNAY